MSIARGCATDALVTQYRNQGFLIIRRLLSARDTDRVRGVFDQLHQPHTRVVTRFAGLVVTRNLWQMSPEIKSVVWKIAPLAARLMGLEQVRLIDDLALIKPAKQDGGDPTTLHQDAPNFPFDRRGFLTVWVAVDDVPLEQGPLTFVPGSHRLGLLGAVDGGAEEVRLESLLHPEDHSHIGPPVTTALDAGDASVHDGAMLHSAGPNLTSRPRRAWGIRFIPPSTLYTGGAHRSFDHLKLQPFHPFDHDEFPLIGSTDAAADHALSTI